MYNRSDSKQRTTTNTQHTHRHTHKLTSVPIDSRNTTNTEAPTSIPAEGVALGTKRTKNVSDRQMGPRQVRDRNYHTSHLGQSRRRFPTRNRGYDKQFTGLNEGTWETGPQVGTREERDPYTTGDTGLPFSWVPEWTRPLKSVRWWNV